MQRTISIYLVLVVVAVGWYCRAAIGWADSSLAGPNAFPGSPDWAYIYGSSLQRYFWMSGMLVGLAIGGATLLAASRAASGTGRGQQAMAVAATVIPVLALAIGNAYE